MCLEENARWRPFNFAATLCGSRSACQARSRRYELSTATHGAGSTIPMAFAPQPSLAIASSVTPSIRPSEAAAQAPLAGRGSLPLPLYRDGRQRKPTYKAARRWPSPKNMLQHIEILAGLAHRTMRRQLCSGRLRELQERGYDIAAAWRLAAGDHPLDS